jgi:predicted DsbA family dithiol-disulfide isomerase
MELQIYVAGVKLSVLKIEIWSDVVCPWCYIGKRRFEAALELFEHRASADIIWRSFELNPAAPKVSPETTREMLASKYGVSLAEADSMQARVAGIAAEEGLVYRLDRTRPSNTFDAHRLIHFAKSKGRQDVMKERLLRAYFMDGAAPGDPETLVALAVDAGFGEQEARTVVAGDAFEADVRADEERAARLGIRGVPFFLAGEKYGASGAQPVEVLLGLLQQAWDAR